MTMLMNFFGNTIDWCDFFRWKKNLIVVKKKLIMLVYFEI